MPFSPNARDTVILDTPASFARSAMVTDPAAELRVLSRRLELLMRSLSPFEMRARSDVLSSMKKPVGAAPATVWRLPFWTSNPGAIRGLIGARLHGVTMCVRSIWYRYLDI